MKIVNLILILLATAGFNASAFQHLFKEKVPRKAQHSVFLTPEQLDNLKAVYYPVASLVTHLKVNPAEMIFVHPVLNLNNLSLAQLNDVEREIRGLKAIVSNLPQTTFLMRRAAQAEREQVSKVDVLLTLNLVNEAVLQLITFIENQYVKTH